MDLNDPVTKLPLVGHHYSSLLEKANISTVYDLLFYIPYRYLDFSKETEIAKAKIGDIVTICGKVVEIKNTYTKRGLTIQTAKVIDKTGAINIIWFNQPYLVNNIKKNEIYSFAGKITLFKNKKTIVSPEYEKKEKSGIHTGRLVPLYSSIKGITSKWLRSRINQALEIYKDKIEEKLPTSTLRKLGYPKINDAFWYIHHPQNEEEIKKGRERLAFEEFLKLQITSLIKKINWQKNNTAPILKNNQETIKSFLKLIPFELTRSQERSVKEIATDLNNKIPMNRLLEGDVGSGKTIVAAFACFLAVKNKKKSVLMAPTEILAKQHYNTFKKIFEKEKIGIGLATASEKKNLENSDIIIGTHALIYKSVNFDKIGLIVIDEQHKFGVKQRASLVEKVKKGEYQPHILTMTATPIPRTIALTAYGNLDLSLLEEMPKGKRNVVTWIVPEEKRIPAYLWIKEKIEKEREQVFVVCPLIEESEKESMKQIKAAESEYIKLKEIFKNQKIGLLHGKLKTKEKDEIIQKYKNGEISILVSTPVVEVGIDVPNANIMIIEAADRFGLAQLHQLRGRVGRGEKKGYCLLFSESQSKKAYKRLEALRKESSGFKLAEIDLSLRGPGEVWGTKQHGFPELKVAKWSDTEIIKKARETAEEILSNKNKYKKIISEWESKIV
ncbi:MAG: ATP-dependent DNA helicase RecG [Patescibacteria group bacterium]|nr:MAG: ATP-dependent DNA helicase RecG [Patescibacteria group bacterium]